MWISYMQEALSGLPVNLEDQPENMLTVRIDSDSGERASPQSEKTRFEIFVAGSEPPEPSAQFQDVGGGQVNGPGVVVEQDDIVDEIF